MTVFSPAALTIEKTSQRSTQTHQDIQIGPSRHHTAVLSERQRDGIYREEKGHKMYNLSLIISATISSCVSFL